MTHCTVYYFVSTHIQNGVEEGLFFLSKLSYITELRFLTVRSYFSVKQYLANSGLFCLNCDWLILDTYRIASPV